MPSLRNYRDISSYDASGKQLCYVTSDEVGRMCADGSHERFCVSCGKLKGEGPCLVTRSNHLMAVRQIAVELSDDATLKAGGESETSLSERDMKRNVGITEGFPGEDAAMGQVRQARGRIRYWRWASAYNCRTVTVVPAAAK